MSEHDTKTGRLSVRGRAHMVASPEQVLEAFMSERRYQADKWGEPPHTLDEFILYVVEYAMQSLHVGGTTSDRLAKLDALRKVGALVLAAMEQHGARPREGYIMPYLDPRETQVEGVLEVDKDIRRREVWVKYGAPRGEDMRFLKMSYEDAHMLRALLDGMSFGAGQCQRCSRWLDKSGCTTTTCHVPTEEVR
jgi:hypothetical protein